MVEKNMSHWEHDFSQEGSRDIALLSFLHSELDVLHRKQYKAKAVHPPWAKGNSPIHPCKGDSISQEDRLPVG